MEDEYTYTSQQIDEKLKDLRDEMVNKINKAIVTTKSPDELANNIGDSSLVLDVKKIEE